MDRLLPQPCVRDQLYICMYACMYVYIYIFVYVCLYVCKYTCIPICGGRRQVRRRMHVAVSSVVSFDAFLNLIVLSPYMGSRCQGRLVWVSDVFGFEGGEIGGHIVGVDLPSSAAAYNSVDPTLYLGSVVYVHS